MSKHILTITGDGQHLIDGKPSTKEEWDAAKDSLDKITGFDISITKSEEEIIAEAEARELAKANGEKKTREWSQEAQDFKNSLTQEEKDADSYLQWSNERLGQGVRALSEIYTETQAFSMSAAAFAIGNAMYDANADYSAVTLGDLYRGKENVGSYSVFAFRTDNMVSWREKLRFKLVKLITKWLY